jgi:transposase
MCAISIRGVVAFETRDGAYDGSSFSEFINTQLKNHFLSNPNDVLVMDNVPFHRRRDVLDLLLGLNISFQFLPPYSPQLNPI